MYCVFWFVELEREGGRESHRYRSMCVGIPLRYWVCLQLVMYDEPTAGLDPIASTVVEDLIRSVHINGHDARGKPGTIASYVVVTHQHSTIRRAVDR